MARMDDDRIVLIGTSRNDSGSALLVVRLLADGTPDPAFGNSGTVTAVVGDGNTEGIAVAVLGNGRILAAGSTEKDTTRRMFVSRLLIDGTPDAGFAEGGTFISAVSKAEHLNCMALQSDGAILLGGDVIGDVTGSGCIIRLTAAGALDGSFGNGGVVEHTSYGSEQDMMVNDMTVDASGKILATGLTNFNSNNDVFVMRLLNDGGLDPAFGLAGETVVTNNAFDEFASAIVLLPGGDLYTVGTRLQIGGDDLLFHHFNASGAPLALGGDVDWQLEHPGSEYASAMRMDAHGHLVVSLTMYDENFIARATVLRLAIPPAVDAAFGADGWLLAPDLESEAGGILFQPDGQLLFCGADVPSEGTNTAWVARYGDIPTSIDGPAPTVQAVLSPNPCTGRFTIHADAAIDRLQVLDATGRVVLDDRSITRGPRTLQLPSSAVAGVYAVSLWSGAYRSVQRLVVE
ncbi:MAG: hypothetical protein QM724_05605 [Flavobacteriales bacterium]